MKRSASKLLSALLCAALLLTLLPTAALAGGEVTESVDGLTFSYTEDAELVRLSDIYDGCPIIIWKGHIQVTDENDETTLLNSAGEDLLSRLRPVWKNEDGDEVEVDTSIDVTVPSDGKYYIGPVTAGSYTFTLEYTPEDGGDPVTVLPELTATISTYEFERITSRTMFNEAASWLLKCAIVGEADGQLYVMSLYADEADGDELAAIPVTPDGDGCITLGNDPALLFAPYHYLGAMKHYGDNTSDETLLWDFGTGIFGAYHIEGYVQEGSMWVSGGTVCRYSGATNADIRIMLTFGTEGDVTMYSPYMGHSDKYLRLAKNEDGSYVFTSKAVDEDTRDSYPVYLYRRYVEVTPTAEEDKYEYIGEPLDKTYDGEAVTLPLDTILASQAGTTIIEQPLNQTGLYGKYVTGAWYKIENDAATQIEGGEIMDEESPWLLFALTGPTEPGDYQFVLQSAFPKDWEADPLVYPVYLTLSFTISPVETHTHTYGDWVPYDDDQHKRDCTAGDDTQYEDHTWDNGTVTIRPTHTTEGEMTYTCSVCGHTKTEPIDKLTEHTYGDWVPYNDDQHKRDCTAGDDTQYEDHSWDNGTVTIRPTHTTEGEMTYTCSVCGHTKTEPIDKTAEHTYGDWVPYDDDQHKRDCTAGDDTQYEDHSWDNGTVTIRPTHTTEGEMTYTCSVCGHTKTEPIPAEGHTYGEWIPHDEAQHKRECTAGDGTQYEPHTMSEWADALTTGNAEFRTCEVCGYWEQRVKQEQISVDEEHTDPDGNLVIDMTEDDQSAVALPDTVFDQIEESAEVSGAAITVGTASVTYDAGAVAAINDAIDLMSGSCSVTLTVEETAAGEPDNGMTDSQQETVSGTANATVYSITLELIDSEGNHEKIEDFNGGTAAVTVPYENPTGGNVQVERVEADGSTTAMPSSYDVENQTVTWITDGHSFYMITAKAPAPIYVPTYAVSVAETENGAITVSPQRAARGTVVTVTVTPDEGYVLDTLAVTDQNGAPVALTETEGGCTFTMPAGSVTVTALFKAAACEGGDGCPTHGFTDLDSGMWYHEAVDFVLKGGLMSGGGNGLFSPNGKLSRAMLAQILYNREGRPDVSGGGTFSDVRAGVWYEDAVIWASAHGIVNGYGGGLFGPGDAITREQLAVMLWRYAGCPEPDSEVLDFPDGDQTSGWARKAMLWATENGIINGHSSGLLDPKGPATRAQAAQMLMNFFQPLKK